MKKQVSYSASVKPNNTIIEVKFLIYLLVITVILEVSYLLNCGEVTYWFKRNDCDSVYDRSKHFKQKI